MKICIPTIDNQGPKGLPSAHFGASPFFTVFDLGTGEWQALGNAVGSHDHGACRPLDVLAGQPVAAVLCRGLGAGAFSRLQQAGIKVYLTDQPDVASCLQAFREGSLRELTEAEVCHGHHHGPGQGHPHRHGGS